MARRRRGVFWPLLLIALGLLFLLQTTGVISGVSWLAIASLWPILLILIGLDIAFAGRWPLATLAAEVLVIAAGLALAAYAPNAGPGVFVFGGSGPGESNITVPRDGSTELALSLSAGATRAYRVTGGAKDLVEAQSANPDLRVRTTGKSVRLDQVTPSGFFHPTDSDIQVQIASDVATSLTVNVGAGEFEIDLSGVSIRTADVNVGASSMHLVLPKPTGDVPIDMNGGASSITVTVPDGVEARISTTGGLISLRSDNPRFGDSGSARGVFAGRSSIETSGYATAHDRVTVTITAGASSIVVR
jgi:Domain of unknown function (DUF5668)